MCLANCLRKRINGLLGREGEEGEVSPRPVTEQEGELRGKQGMQESHWTWSPVPEKDPQLGQKPAMQGHTWEIQRGQGESRSAPKLETQL